MDFQSRYMLVTGGAGFIGANFIHYVLKNDATVTIINLDALNYAGSLNNLKNLIDPSRHIFIHGNICDPALVKTIFEKYNIDTVVHFAAETHVDRSITGPLPFVQSNILGTFTLLDIAKDYWLTFPNKFFRFHHISTDEVFGALNKDQSCFREKSPYAPNSPYSASKAGADHLVRAYFRTYGFPISVSHCSNNYGPYQHTEKLIPTIIQACRQQKPIPIYGDGSHIRDWLYVEDHCTAILRILRQGALGETYNIGGNNEVNNLALAEKICTLMDDLYPSPKKNKTLITFVEDRLGHDWRYGIDISKIQKELNWQPSMSFEEGILKTIRFYEDSLEAELN